MTGNTSFRENDKNAFMSKDLPLFVEDLFLFVEDLPSFCGRPVSLTENLWESLRENLQFFFCCHVGYAVSCTQFL